jgi:Wings apart-like protein regulation of heterochromatin
MFVMSRDHLAMDIDKSSLQLMLRLLNADDVRKAADDVGEYNRIRQRLHAICSSSSLSVAKNRNSKPIAPEDTTVSTSSFQLRGTSIHVVIS